MSTGRVTSRHRGVLMVCAAGVLWGTGGLVATLLHERDGLGAMTTSAWRMLIGAVALVLFALATSRLAAAWQVARRHPVRVTLLGCGTATYQGLYFVSVLMVGVSVATVVALGLAPVLTSVAEHVERRTRPSWREVAVLACALTGLVLVSTSTGHGSSTGSDPATGLLLAVAAGAVYALTTLVGRDVARSADPRAVTTAATSVGAVALAPFLWLASASGEPLVVGSATSALMLAYLGVATMALAYGLLYSGLRTTSGSSATVATLVEPLSAAVLAALVLSEALPLVSVLGGTMILAAVVAMPSSPQQSATVTRPPPLT